MATMTRRHAAKAIATVWQLPEYKGKSFNSDAVIDAYLQGKEDGFAHGMNDMQRLAIKELKDNASKAATLTRMVLDFLEERKLNTVDTYLKVSSWDELSVMILVKDKSFLSPSFKEVYRLVSELENTSEQENLALEFAFAPYSKEFSLACLNSDGYALRLKQEGGVMAAVPAA